MKSGVHHWVELIGIRGIPNDFGQGTLSSEPQDIHCEFCDSNCATTSFIA